MSPLSRRQFLKNSAIPGAAASLSGCSVFANKSTAEPQPVQNTPAAVDTQPVKNTPEPPKSVVVHTHHSGVWANDTLLPAVMTQMLDASITKLTGLADPLEAWKALFHPKEKIAIKINTIAGSITGTHPPFLAAVLERLKAAGFPDEQIFVYEA
jgi:hypothetical protein